MNNLFKFTTLIFLTLGVAWLAFVVGTRSQFGDLLQSPETLNEDGSIPEDVDLYPMELSDLPNKVPMNTSL